MSALTIVHIVALVGFMIVAALALLTLGREKSAKPMTFFINMSVAMFFLLFYVYITEFYFDLGALILLCLGVILGLLGGLATKIYARGSGFSTGSLIGANRNYFYRTTKVVRWSEEEVFNE